jgi:TonB family protein
MLESKILFLTERLWPAGFAALVMHSAVIAAVALGTTGFQGISSQDFHVEVMFASQEGTKTNEASSAALIEDIGSQKREKAIEELASRVKVSKSVQKSKEKKTSTTSISSTGVQPVGDTLDAFPIYNPPPIYPLEAKQKRIQGIVLVRLFLTETGIVDKAIPLFPRSDPVLEAAALKAIHQWQFRPGIRTVEVPIEFKLEV